MSININDYDGKLIKSFNPLNKPIKMFINDYISKIILFNKYDNLIIVNIDKNTIKMMDEKQLKEHCKILKRKYRQNKKNEEINIITKENEEIIENDPMNINIIDYNGNILKTITQQFKKSKYLLYKPFIEKEFPNMFDVKINENTIKIMNEEQYKNYKKTLKKEYRQKNREKLIIYDKQYNEEHKEEINEKQKIYYQEHKEQITEYKKKLQSEYKKKYREINREKLIIYDKQYYQNKKQEQINERLELERKKAYQNKYYTQNSSKFAPH